jgi:hypothetical protein
MNKTPASPDLPQADPVSEVMALAETYAGVVGETYGHPIGSERLRDAARAALEARVRELEKDAARYRWLRVLWVSADNLDADGDPAKPALVNMIGEDLDAAIDSARHSEHPTPNASARGR